MYIAAERKTAEAFENAGEDEKALAVYLGILPNITREHAGYFYADVEVQIAKKYFDLSRKQDEEANLGKAIFYLNDALTLISPEYNPYEFASAEMLLGKAYFVLGTIRNPDENYPHAISAFNASLQVCTPWKYPEEYEALNNNLAAVYIKQGMAGNQERNLADAEAAYSRIFTVISRESNPESYAENQVNIGNMYALIGDVKNNATNRRLAEDAYAEAGKILTAEKYPERYADFRTNYEGLLVREHVIGRNHPPVRGQGISGFQQDQVADHDIAGWDRGRMAVPDNPDRNIIPVGVQHIELFAAPVLVEECDAGGKQDGDNDTEGVEQTAALDKRNDERDTDCKEQDPYDRVVEFFQVLFPERLPDRRGHGIGAVERAELRDLFVRETAGAGNGFLFIQ